LLLAACGSGPSNDSLLATARQLEARGETKSAIIELKNLIQRAPRDAAARLALGRLYLDTGDVLSAEKEMRRAMALGKPGAEVMPWLGKALLLQGQFGKMLDEIVAGAQQPKLMALRGHALLGLHRNTEAAAVFEQILVRHPDHPAALIGQARIALQAADRPRALALTNRALQHFPDDVDAWRLKGDLLRLQDDNPGALAAYRRALALHPALVQAHVDIASLHIQAGQFDQARAELAIARRVSPNSLMLIYTQALLDFRQGKLQAAREQLQLVLRAAPEHLPSHLLMGVVMRGVGSYPQAEQHLRKFLEANPGQAYASKLLASVLMHGGDPAGALAVIEPLLPHSQQDVEMLALAGELYLRLRRYQPAAAHFERASALAPQTTMLRTALAMSHLGLGDTGRAIAQLEEAASADEKSPRTGVLLVLTQLRSKDYAGALESVRRLEAHQQNNPMVYNLKGGVLLLQRDNPGARASFERALKADPLFLPALDNLTQLDLNEKQPDQARQRLEAALKRDPGNLDLMVALANVAITSGQTTVAQAWLERAVQRHPDDVDASLRLARFYARTSVPKALQLLEKLAASHPDHAPVLTQLAQLQERGGKPDDALANWIRLAALQPTDIDVQLRIADLRTAAGDYDGAYKALSKVLALAPAHGSAQVAQVRLLIRQQAWLQATQVVRGYQKARPADALPYKLEADILLARKQLLPAVGLYQKAYQMQPSAPMLIPLYSALVQAGRPDQARQRMQQWLTAHDDDRTTRLYYANSLLAERDFAASTAQFEQLQRLAPRNIVVLNNLAWLYQQQKDSRALATAEQAYGIAPNNPVVLDTLGWILAEHGQRKRAEGLLKRAVHLAPDNDDIRRHLEAVLARADTAATVASR
jgi:putative PEP-CTERM system TPR-repeat lipoprotein